ncbi:hypothetical protein Y032_0246g3 [Ancylostoma ceylanicum]|uniref:Uncharacterized protein n=1 Tax=Ancylostoma ceylanicum TaxID=53326 RepID=A0A016SCW3_9BILA|nr:hypothetical protein Y032_0246g3 [Ancylostoma ceylanicum]
MTSEFNEDLCSNLANNPEAMLRDETPSEAVRELPLTNGGESRGINEITQKVNEVKQDEGQENPRDDPDVDMNCYEYEPTPEDNKENPRAQDDWYALRTALESALMGLGRATGGNGNTRESSKDWPSRTLKAAPAEILALEISPHFGVFRDGKLIGRDKTV